jgi:hypothetical protein
LHSRRRIDATPPSGSEPRWGSYVGRRLNLRHPIRPFVVVVARVSEIGMPSQSSALRSEEGSDGDEKRSDPPADLSPAAAPAARGGHRGRCRRRTRLGAGGTCWRRQAGGRAAPSGGADRTGERDLLRRDGGRPLSLDGEPEGQGLGAVHARAGRPCARRAGRDTGARPAGAPHRRAVFRHHRGLRRADGRQPGLLPGAPGRGRQLQARRPRCRASRRRAGRRAHPHRPPLR